MSQEKKCDKKACDMCICITCMHQGFDCQCETENSCAVNNCEDYDEMVGEQMSLQL